MNNSTTLRTILGSQTTDKSVHSQAILEVLKAAGPDERVELLAIAISERDSVEKHPKGLANKGIPPESWNTFVRTHNDMVHGYLKMAFFRAHTATEFAQDILKLVDLFASDDEKTFALATALYSPYVPFHELPGTPISMTVEKYAHLIKSNTKKRQLIEYLVELPFSTITEEVSMLLQVLDDTEDRELRAALLGHYVQSVKQSVMQSLIRRIGTAAQ